MHRFGEPCWTPLGCLNGTCHPQAAWVAVKSVRFGIVKASIKRWAGLGCGAPKGPVPLFICAVRHSAPPKRRGGGGGGVSQLSLYHLGGRPG